MIDRDPAEMYGIETRVLNQAILRNIDRFPSDLMFQLTDEEFLNSGYRIDSQNPYLSLLPW
jgi:hypothetical protein